MHGVRESLLHQQAAACWRRFNLALFSGFLVQNKKKQVFYKQFMVFICLYSVSNQSHSSD